jgi:hypothetical protein
VGPGTPRRRTTSSIVGFGWPRRLLLRRARARRQIVACEPASWFWDFQWTETAIFIAAAVALAGLCVWRIRTRRGA